MNYLADTPDASAAASTTAPAPTTDATETKDEDEVKDKLLKAKKLAH